MSWQHAIIQGALIAGNAIFEIKILVDCFEWHMSTNITQAHAPSQSLHPSNQRSSHWQCQSNVKTMRLISFRLNVERARSLTCLLLCYYYNRSNSIGGISACKTILGPFGPHMNIHEANVHVSTSFPFHCWCNFTCRTICLALPFSTNDVVHDNTKANSREAKRSREHNNSWRERKNEWTSVNVQTIKIKQNDRSHCLCVCASTIGDVCSVCVWYVCQ